MTQQKQFAGTGDVSGLITGGARNGMNWDFMDQQGKVLTSVPYQDFVNNYQSDGSGAVRSGVSAVNGVPVYNFSKSSAAAPAATSPGPVAATQPIAQPTAQPTAAAASPAGQGIVGGTINNVTTSQNAAAQNLAQYNPVSGLSMQTYTPQTREVNQATETAAGQVNSLLANDNPLLQRARTLARQNMAQRGLVNSSMAQGAGVGAMIDRITPIAQQDAQTYSNRAMTNMDAVNRAGEFNAGQNNQLFSQGLGIASQFGLQDSQQKFTTSERLGSQQFQSGERQATQEFQTSERVGTQQFQSLEAIKQREFTSAENDLDRVQQTRIVTLQENGMDRRQAENIAASERQQASAQAFQAAEARANREFTAQQAEADRTAAVGLEKLRATNNEAAMRLADQISDANVPANFASTVALNTSNSINAILADPNIKPEDKPGAIANIVTAANSTISWGSTLYNTPIPAITAPAPKPAPAPAPQPPSDGGGG